ncbi:acyltransferase [Companilactobacillus alimentarius]|uniref:Acyltransferase n=1 Tax=Companilactobacillus alimentarius DSM 20249 TaxID=1423720 RepID=A0A2K9HLK9_9LACO|nr:acyltransferase [Companilactobacillus alimentarius]AUI72837.1 acyltransferase [Companilactobacillus alimentarius DSM 20249]KRK75852.1 Acyltransferase [Companilactobacillus alimentarius DSM 20249]GEO45827.1 acyltransferase [Companilactobacillus alimentarius]
MATKKKKKYLYEVDLMRVLFIGGVLLNHTTTAFKNNVGSGSGSQLFIEATHLMLHFTRMGFMFMTGLVLVLNYYNRDNHWLGFWKKRYISVGIPYIGWNAILMWFATITAGVAINWPSYYKNLIDAIIHGNKYYMYYILVTFQLYLIFPLLVYMFKKLPNHHIAILVTSAIVQLLLVIGIKYWLPGVDRDSWWYLFRAYGLNVLVYQFYFIAGAFVAIHYDQVDKFIEKNHRVIGWSTLALSIGTVLLFFGNQYILKLSMSATESIHQPLIFIYDTFMIAFVFWIGRQYAHARNHGLPNWMDRIVRNMAKVSFGIYLVQTIPITLLYGILSTMHLPSIVMLLLLPVGYVFVLGGAFLISWFCYKIPPFGVLIGRPQWHLTKGVKKYVRNNESVKNTVKE